MKFIRHIFTRKIYLSLRFSSCLSYRHLYSTTQEEDKKMAEETTSFLKNMPAGLQEYQAEAIRKAIEGDYTTLDDVRNKRNQPARLSSNVSTRMLTPTLCLYEPKEKKNKKLPLLIYLHGGGWTFGSINSCGSFCNAVADSGCAKVLAVNYRLAPEHPYPAAVEDCIEAIKYAYEHIHELNISKEHISIGGDSSGGNLALASVLNVEHTYFIRSLILFYPVTKAFDDKSLSWKTYGKGYGLDANIMQEFNRSYTQGQNINNPLISVALCKKEKLKKIPHTLLITAGKDILHDQGYEFAINNKKLITYVNFPQSTHLFITVPGQNEAFKKAVNLTIKFLSI